MHIGPLTIELQSQCNQCIVAGSAVDGRKASAGLLHAPISMVVVVKSLRELSLLRQGLDLLEYAEHTDYDLVESTNPAFNKALVRINVFRSHRQACLVPYNRCSCSQLAQGSTFKPCSRMPLHVFPASQTARTFCGHVRSCARKRPADASQVSALPQPCGSMSHANT